METDDLSTWGLVALGAYLLYKVLTAAKVAKFGPAEVVTSTITYPPALQQPGTGTGLDVIGEAVAAGNQPSSYALGPAGQIWLD